MTSSADRGRSPRRATAPPPVDAERIALASYPRSGNTWIRFLLESATGERCGSIYDDRIMPRGSRGLVIKTHALDSARYARAIHLVRNPFDVIESHFYWKRDVAGNRQVEWDTHVANGIEEWQRHTEHWLTAPVDIRRVRYEDLHAAPAAVLADLVQWLNRRVTAAAVEAAVAAGALEEMRTLHPKLGTAFFRRGAVGASYTAFSRSQREKIRRVLGPLLDRFGYADMSIPSD